MSAVLVMVERLRTRRLALWSVVASATVAAVGAGVIGIYRYVDNYWLYRGFAPPTDPTFVSTRGTFTSLTVTSAALGGRTQPVDVYLPPGYASHPEKRYPVVYLLHGFPGVPSSYFKAGRLGVVEDILVARHLMRPVILVAPFGSTGVFTDKEWANGVRKHEGWETYFARDVVHAVDARYRTIPAGWARALVGLSEGGYGALNIAFHHPGEFSVIESWSGYMLADRSPAIFGRKEATFTYNSPLDYLPRVAAALRREHVLIWFYTGKADPLRSQNAAFATELERYRVDHRFFVDAGGHTWHIWRANARAALLAATTRLAHAR